MINRTPDAMEISTHLEGFPESLHPPEQEHISTSGLQDQRATLDGAFAITQFRVSATTGQQHNVSLKRSDEACQPGFEL
jgi:hypothetical protein